MADLPRALGSKVDSDVESQETRPNTACRYFFYLIVIVGIVILLETAFHARFQDIGYQWLILAALTVITGSFTVKIPGVDSRISVADTFIFTNIVLFGTAAGTVTAALDGLAGSVRFKSKPRQLEYALFNSANMGLSAYLAGLAFYRVLGRPPLSGTGGISLSEAFVPMAILGLVHYFSNSGIVALMIALESRLNAFKVWRESFLWTGTTYLTCASVAIVIAVNASAVTPFVLAALLPILVVIYFEYKAHQEKTEEQIKRRELNDLYLRTVESLALAVDAKDQTTHSHLRRVRAYAEGLAALRGITGGSELMAIQTGALLHDIGKLAVDDYILNKPGKLTVQEFDRMKMHALAGHEIVEQIQFPFPVAKFVRGHHERWDGRGYPDGLKGEDIPLGARILAIADAFDAMRSWRPYKQSLSMQDSLEELRSKAGSIFDPQLIELFINNISDLESKAVAAAKNSRELSFRSAIEAASRPQVASSTTPFHHPLTPAATVELVSLYEFCASLAPHLDLQDLYVNIAQRIGRLVPSCLCVFYAANGSGTIRVEYAAGKHSDHIRNMALEVGKGVSGWVAAYHQPMTNTSAAMEFHGLPFDVASLKDALVVPMLSEGACVGTISLFAESPMSYSHEHLNLLQVVAKQVAPIIAEARAAATRRSEQGEIEVETRAYHASYLSFVASNLIASSRATGAPFSIIYLDINNFSQLVKLCGSDAGDAILKGVAESLRSELRSEDFLVQFGREGFVALLEGIGREACIRSAQRLQRRVREIKMGTVAGHNVYVFQQTGVATYPEDGTTITELLESAQRHLALKASQPEPIPDKAGARPQISEAVIQPDPAATI